MRIDISSMITAPDKGTGYKKGSAITVSQNLHSWMRSSNRITKANLVLDGPDGKSLSEENPVYSLIMGNKVRC